MVYILSEVKRKCQTSIIFFGRGEIQNLTLNTAALLSGTILFEQLLSLTLAVLINMVV